MNPANSALEAVVITEFLGHQQELLRMLVVAERCNINTARVPVEFFKLLRLTLGETFQFVIHHQERHFLQLNRTLAAVSNTSAAALIV